MFPNADNMVSLTLTAFGVGTNPKSHLGGQRKRAVEESRRVTGVIKGLLPSAAVF